MNGPIGTRTAPEAFDSFGSFGLPSLPFRIRKLDAEQMRRRRSGLANIPGTCYLRMGIIKPPRSYEERSPHTHKIR
jgi:hypothetical protein